MIFKESATTASGSMEMPMNFNEDPLSNTAGLAQELDTLYTFIQSLIIEVC